MATKIIKIPVLTPGQEVGIQNCREHGFVVAPVGKGLYTVRYQQHTLTLPRNQLSVLRNGRMVSH